MANLPTAPAGRTITGHFLGLNPVFSPGRTRQKIWDDSQSFRGWSVLVLSSVGSPVGRSLCVGFVQVSRGVLLVEASALGVLWDQYEDEQDDRANDRY